MVGRTRRRCRERRLKRARGGELAHFHRSAFKGVRHAPLQRHRHARGVGSEARESALHRNAGGSLARGQYAALAVPCERVLRSLARGREVDVRDGVVLGFHPVGGGDAVVEADFVHVARETVSGPRHRIRSYCPEISVFVIKCVSRCVGVYQCAVEVRVHGADRVIGERHMRPLSAHERAFAACALVSAYGHGHVRSSFAEEEKACSAPCALAGRKNRRSRAGALVPCGEGQEGIVG